MKTANFRESRINCQAEYLQLFNVYKLEGKRILRVLSQLNGQHQNFSMWNSLFSISIEIIIGRSNIEIFAK